MIGLLGLKSGLDISVRESFAVPDFMLQVSLKKLKALFDEILILNTCNRTEIYFVTEIGTETARALIFESLNWDKSNIDSTFIIKDEKAVEHLMKVSCGFHSKILGEEHILGQIKKARQEASEADAIKAILQKLFQQATETGKDFRKACELYKIPVSAASIAVNDCINKNIKNLMVLGYGDIGKLTVKHALKSKFINKIYLAVRDIKKAQEDELIRQESRVSVISFSDKDKFYNQVDALISSTSAPHIVIKKSDIDNIKNKKSLIFYDLAVPRDIDEGIRELSFVELYNIDNLNEINEENKKARKEIMYKNIGIIEQQAEDYMKWLKLREIVPGIRGIKQSSQKVFEVRYSIFKNKQKTKSPEELAEKLIKSAVNVYTNRAIEVLKEEKLKGREEECMNILKRIFPGLE